MMTSTTKEAVQGNTDSSSRKLQAMAPIGVSTQQYVTEQASFPRNHHSVTGDNYSDSSLSLPQPFDKEKLLAMQAQVLQGRMQSNTISPLSVELTKAEIPTGPVKRQVAEAWNNEKRKRNYETPKPLIEEQHEVSKTLGTCQCCEHYGHLCLQEDSLMTAKAR